MSSLYDTNAPKKPTNLTVNSDLLLQAKNMHINISSVLEAALVEKLKQELKDKWLQENSESIKNYNQQVERFGVFSDELRNF